MNELAFELYGVPSICTGVDALFSYYQNAAADDAAGTVPPGLIVNGGHTNTTLMAFLPPGDRVAPSTLRRCGGHRPLSTTGPSGAC